MKINNIMYLVNCIIDRTEGLDKCLIAEARWKLRCRYIL